MYFADIEDDTSMLSILVWPGTVKEFKKIFVPGNILDAIIEKDEDKITLYSAKKISTFYKL